MNSSNLTKYFNKAMGLPVLVKKPLVNFKEMPVITKGKVKAE